MRPKGVLEGKFAPAQVACTGLTLTNTHTFHLGRAIFVSVFFESGSKPKPVWLVCVYAPVRTEEQTVFFRRLTKVWYSNVKIKETDAVIVTGDFNARIF